MRVLVLDANQRAALATTRALGRAGHYVITADESPVTLAGASRHSKCSIVYPSPYRVPHEFIRWLGSIHTHDLDVIIPVSEVTTDLVLRNRGAIPEGIRIPFTDVEVIDCLSNKVHLHKTAVKLGIPVPESVGIFSPADIETAIQRIGFPAILKPARSRIRGPRGYSPTSVVLVENEYALRSNLSRPEFIEHPFLYQRCVEGPGQGIFALYSRGRLLALFAHRRIREKPPSGGVSVVSESVPADPALVDYTRRLLEHHKLDGVAMVEFKGRYLLEVNARLWGSLQLAIDAGVNFPELLVASCYNSASIDPVLTWESNRRLRWLLGDLDRLYLVAKSWRHVPFRNLLTEIASFLRPHFLNTRHEVFRWSDPLPAVIELSHYIRQLASRRK